MSADRPRPVHQAGIIHTQAGIIHTIAICRECGWRSEDYRRAARAAVRHVQRSGHTVAVEQGHVYLVAVRAADAVST